MEVAGDFTVTRLVKFQTFCRRIVTYNHKNVHDIIRSLMLFQLL